MKTNWKLYMKKIEAKGKRYIITEQKKLKKIGAIILSVITITGSILIIFKVNNSRKIIDNKPAKVIEMKTNNKQNETKIFLEHVEQLKSGLYEVSSLVFSEEMMRMNETFGESSKDFVTVQGNFKIKYSIDIERIRIDYNFDEKEVVLKVPKDSIGVDSVELIGNIKETEKYESFGNKIKDWIPTWNNDEEMKENAIKQLLSNSKIEARNYNKKEVNNKAKTALNDILRKLNMNDLKYKIEFIDRTEIGIKQ